MRWTKTLLLRLRSLLRRSRVEHDIDEELRYHLDRQTDEFIASGMNATEARHAALRAMGGFEQRKEECRDTLGLRVLDEVQQDTGYALRRLVKHPGFTAIAVSMVALGIGANTAIFSVLRASSLRSSPFPDPDRLAIIWTTPSGHPESLEAARLSEFIMWREQTQAFDSIGEMNGWSSTLGSMQNGEPADRLNGWRFSASTFQALRVQPQLGRLLTDEDCRTQGRPNVVIVSDRFWRVRFGGDPAVLGRTLLLDGASTTIVGVMPPNFGVLDTQSDFWLPVAWTTFQLQSRSPNRVLTIIGHLKPGVSVERAQAEIEAINARLAKEDPGPQQGRGIKVQLLDTALFGNVRRLLRVLQAAVGFVLLIACANVAGLLLARAASQQKEVAIRAALGARRVRIVRLFLIESLILSLSGGILGILLAWVAGRLLNAASPTWLSQLQRIEVDAGVLAFSVAVSMLTGVIFGMAPPLVLWRSDLITPLKDSSRTATSSLGHRRLQSALVVAQVALTLVVLVGAGLLIKTFWNLQRVPLGLEPSQVLSFQTRLPANQYFKQVGLRDGFAQLDVSPVPSMVFDRIRERLRQVPGVVSAAGTNMPPIAGDAMQAPFRIEGKPALDAGAGADINSAFSASTTDLFANYAIVTPDYFSTLRIPLIRGRDFAAHDIRGTLPVAIINATMARRFWPNEDPIGQHVTVTIVSDEPPREIIGVVGDTPVSRWDRSPAPALYVPQLQESLRSRVPYGQSRMNMMFVLRINKPLAYVVPPVRRAVAEVNASLPVSQIVMMDQYLARQIEAPRDSMVLVGIFAGIALLLTALGIYAIVAYGVVQRTHEIGIRMALGARRAAVLRLVSRQSIALTIAGIILGLAGALAVTRYLENLLFEVTPFDVATFVPVSVLFVAVAAVASFVAARRATRIDPQIVLRCE